MLITMLCTHDYPACNIFSKDAIRRRILTPPAGDPHRCAARPLGLLCLRLCRCTPPAFELAAADAHMATQLHPAYAKASEVLFLLCVSKAVRATKPTTSTGNAFYQQRCRATFDDIKMWAVVIVFLGVMNWKFPYRSNEASAPCAQELRTCIGYLWAMLIEMALSSSIDLFTQSCLESQDAGYFLSSVCTSAS